MQFKSSIWAVFLALSLVFSTSCSDDIDPGPGGSDDGGTVEQDAETPDPDMNPDPVDMGMPIDDMGSPTDMEQPFDFGQPDMDEPDMGPVFFGIDQVVPPRGPLKGGTPIVIKGSKLTDETAVFFGSQRADVRLVDGDLVGEAPAGDGVGPINVKLLDPVEGEANLEDGYTYIETLSLTEVSPTRIPSAGNVEVTIRGTGFDNNTRISFGGETALSHSVINSGLLRVLAPPHPAGEVQVRATNRDESVVWDGVVVYFDALRLDAVRPGQGDVAGGETVTLEGAGFEAGMTVQFDGAAATLQSVDPSGATAVVDTPAGASGPANVRIVTSTDAVIAPDAYLYTQAGDFSLIRAVPNRGPEIGGNDIELFGAGLGEAGVTVTIGGAAAPVQSQEPGRAIVRVPAGTAGAADIVATDGTDTASLTGGYTYVANLWLDRVTPNSGSTAGGETVTLEGEGFTGATRVTLGGVAATFTVIDNQTIEVTAPAHSAGSVDVVVERDGIKGTFVDGYTYTEPLEVFGLKPVRGSIAGGTYVEVYGRGFVGSPTVTFDGQPAADVQVVDAQTITLRTPPHPSGDVVVEVTVGGETQAAPQLYTYFNPGSRFGGTWGGPIQGSVNVSVYEMGGAPIEGAFVMLSSRAETPYQGNTDANGLVTLSGPDVFGEQTITAIAAGYSSASVQRVNAENVTIFLSPPPQQGPPPPGPPVAQYSGMVTGLDKLAEPGPGEVQMAIVMTTRPDPFSRIPDPGSGSVIFQSGPYTITSRIGDLALIAVGGLYNNNTNEFKPLRMGIERYLFAADGQTYTVDLDLDIPLETQVTFKLASPPSTAPDRVVVPWIDLGFEGVFNVTEIVEGRTNLVVAQHQPAFAGALADAEYFIQGGAYPNGNTGALPQTNSFLRGVTDVSKVLELPGLFGAAVVTSPANGAVPVDRLFQFRVDDSSNPPDLYYVTIMTPMQVTVWNVFVPGHERSFRLPDFPDFSHLPAEERPVPYPGGTYIMDIIGISAPGLDYANLSYADLGSLESWDGYSYTRTVITF